MCDFAEEEQQQPLLAKFRDDVDSRVVFVAQLRVNMKSKLPLFFRSLVVSCWLNQYENLR